MIVFLSECKNSYNCDRKKFLDSFVYSVYAYWDNLIEIGGYCEFNQRIGLKVANKLYRISQIYQLADRDFDYKSNKFVEEFVNGKYRCLAEELRIYFLHTFNKRRVN